MKAAIRIVVLGLLPSLVSPAQAGSDIRAHYDDDFILETADGAFQLKIRGNLHVDARAFQAVDGGAPSAIDLRRGRIDLQGRLYEWITFRLQPELVGGPYLRNAWVDLGPFPWLHLRIGQMKVPFSTSWATLDNNVNFVERGSAPPVYPFFDRGILVWGELWEGALVYNAGAFTGVGVDKDVASGDLDDHKDLAARLFAQPLRHVDWPLARGLYLVIGGTWGQMSVPTSRLETGGLRAADFETALWRWRSEQVIGSDDRVTDRIGAEIDYRARWSGELHYLYGPLAISTEYLECYFRGITIFHDLMVGSSRPVHEKLLRRHGSIRSVSSWVSYYLTGEHKRLTNFGWKTAKPEQNVGDGGLGAIEVLARYSYTWSDPRLFATLSVPGFVSTSAGLPADYHSSLPGAENNLKAAILDGAHEVHEFTVGISWTLNPMLRVQLNDVLLWAPAADRDGDGENDNFLISGAKSEQSDPEKKNRKLTWENAVMARLIFKL